MPNDVIIAMKFRSMGPKTASRSSNVAFMGCPALNKPTNIPNGKDTIPQTTENTQIAFRP